MIFASGIFIDNTGNAVLAVNTGFASGTSDSQAIGSIFTLQTNRPILAVDDDRRAVFPIDADFTIFAVSTFFANAEVICQFQVICFLPFIVGYINLQIFADIGCTFRSCTAFDSDFRMLRSKRLYFIQLIHIDSIGSLFTGSYVMNLLVIHGNIRLGNRRPIFDRQAIIINDGISRLDGTFFTKVNLLGQLDFQLAAYVINANVFVCQFLCISSADDIELFIQLLRDNRIIIAFELQTFTKYFRILGSHISNSIKLTAINSIRTSCGKQPWRDILNPSRSFWRTNTHNTRSNGTTCIRQCRTANSIASICFRFSFCRFTF